MRMTKADLVAEVAQRTGMTKRAAHQAINAMMAAIAASLNQGNSVGLVGFGTFAVARRGERVARNPRTGAPIKIPARRVPVFRPGKTLRETV
jgi:DNA-binding protein HU-beta